MSWTYSANRLRTTAKPSAAVSISIFTGDLSWSDRRSRGDRRRAERRLQLVERIDERVGLRAVDADDAVQPRRHGDRLDDQWNQPTRPIAHVEHLADDGFFLTIVAVQVTR